MTTPRRATPRILGWTAAGLVGLAAAAGTAQASNSWSTNAASNSTLAAAATAAATDPAAPADPAPAGKAHGHGSGKLGGHGLHGEITVKAKGGGYQVVEVQRGAVKATGNGSVTVASVDGFQASYAVTGETKIRRAKAAIAAGDLKVDDQVVVAALKGADGALTAKAIGVQDPNAKPKARAGKKGTAGLPAPSSPAPAPSSPNAAPGMYAPSV